MTVQPKFKLKNPSSNLYTSIQLKIYYNKKRIVYGIGKSVLPELWDFELERPTKNRYFIKKAEKENPFIKMELRNLTTYINDVSKEVQKFFADSEVMELEINSKIVKSHLDKEFKTYKYEKEQQEAETIDLNKFVAQFIEDIQEGRRTTKTGKNYAKGTIKNYLSFQSELNSYQKARHCVLGFEDITLDFYGDYVAYFNSKRYSPNTIGRHIKQLKRIMKAAFNLKLHSNTQFALSDFATIDVPTVAIALNEKELQRMADLDLSKQRTLEECRDIFLVGCYTAQRYSDYSRLSADHVKVTEQGNKVIELIQRKTSKKVIIPLHPIVESIFDKYGGVLPKSHEQKINKRIKEIGELAKINQMISIEKIKGGEKVTIQKAKCELIMTHTARRSGATIMQKAKMSKEHIRNITGHSTIKQLETYLKLTKEEIADMVALHPFFTGEKVNHLKAVK